MHAVHAKGQQVREVCVSNGECMAMETAIGAALPQLFVLMHNKYSGRGLRDRHENGHVVALFIFIHALSYYSQTIDSLYCLPDQSRLVVSYQENKAQSDS